MKIRMGFVSNSSSSSFVVAKALMTEEQICDLLDFCSSPVGTYHDSWCVYEDEDGCVRGITTMHNNDIADKRGIQSWFKKNGIYNVTWEYD